jgi:hypothetical protein
MLRTLLAFLLCMPAFGAGTVTQSLARLGSSWSGTNYVLTISWTGDATNGSVPSTRLIRNGPDLANTDGYYIYRVETDPGTPAPSAAYDIVINNGAGLDIMAGGLENRSATDAEVVPAASIPINGTLTFALSNNVVAGARGTVAIYMTVSSAALAHATSHGTGQADAITVAQSQVTDLTVDLAGKVEGAAALATANAIPKITAAGTLGESAISDDGSTVTVTGRNVAITPTLPAGAAAASGQLEYWVKYTIPYTSTSAPDFRTAGTSLTKTVLAVPAGACVAGVGIKPSVAFAGTGITALTLSLGDGTTADVYAPSFNLLTAASATNQWNDYGCNPTTSAAHNIVATFTANTNFGAAGATVLTAGSVDLLLAVKVRPAWSVAP